MQTETDERVSELSVRRISSERELATHRMAELSDMAEAATGRYASTRYTNTAWKLHTSPSPNGTVATSDGHGVET